MSAIKKDYSIPLPTDPMWCLARKPPGIRTKPRPRYEVPLADPTKAQEEKGLYL
jgi:hypothetical protein